MQKLYADFEIGVTRADLSHRMNAQIGEKKRSENRGKKRKKVR